MRVLKHTDIAPGGWKRNGAVDIDVLREILQDHFNGCVECEDYNEICADCKSLKERFALLFKDGVKP